jgi:sugar-specific transcriptional regulator TrmB
LSSIISLVEDYIVGEETTRLGLREDDGRLNPISFSPAEYRNRSYLDGGSKRQLETLIVDDLKGLGLTERESEVYIGLSKRKIMKAGDLSRQVGLHKAQVYHILKSLQDKGLVDSTLEVPARFTAVPLEKFLSLSIKARIEDAKHLEKCTDEVLSRWRSMGSDASSIPLERFQIMSGRSNVYARILQMIDDAEAEVAILSTAQGVVRSYEAEVHDAVFRRAKRNRGVRFRLLTSVTELNLAIMKQDLDEIRLSGLDNIDGRHVEVEEAGFLSSFVLKDEEAIVFVTPPGISLAHGQEETALWTNSSSVTRILRMLFERLWRDGMDKDERLRQLSSEVHAHETIMIKDSQIAYERLRGAIASAREEIVGVTDPSGSVGALELPFQELGQRGVRLRIMTAIDETNHEGTDELAKHCEVRGVNSIRMRAVLVDKQHLFQLRSAPDSDTTHDIPASLDSMFYTNDPVYTDGFYMMLNELWAMSQDLPGMNYERPAVLLQSTTMTRK